MERGAKGDESLLVILVVGSMLSLIIPVPPSHLSLLFPIA